LLHPFSTTVAKSSTIYQLRTGTTVASTRRTSPLLPHEQQEQEQEQDVSVNLANVKKNNEEKKTYLNRVQWRKQQPQLAVQETLREQREIKSLILI
jgi:hypothetical protein